MSWRKRTPQPPTTPMLPSTVMPQPIAPPVTIVPIYQPVPVAPSRPVMPPSNFLTYIQALPLADGIQLIHKVLDAMQVLEREETRRTEIQADTKIRLANIEAGREIMMELVNREYDNRDLAVKSMTEVITLMTQMGNTDAALELSKMLMEKKLDSQFIRELLAFRNQHASAGLINIQVTNTADC
jgi:hypothetical protein